MSNITFKKNSKSIEKVTDIINPIFIEHEYFGFNDSNFPFDSFQFKTLLDEKRISLISIEKSSLFYNQLVDYITIDEGHQKQIRNQEKAILRAKKEAEKKEAEKQKELEKKEANRKKEEKKQEAKRNNQKVRIVTGEDISESITENL